jgi:putative pyoverdin transport system ATP-binding/permease protein
VAELVKFFDQTPREAWFRLLILSVISAGANASVLAIVNYRIANFGADVRWQQWEALAAILVAISCFALAHRALINTTTKLVENVVRDARVRLFERIQAIELRDIEQLDVEQIYVCINTEMHVIADAAFTFATLSEQALILVFTLIYLSWLSVAGFFCALGFIWVSAFLHFSRNAEVREKHQDAFELASGLTGRFSDSLAGFKEVKLNAARRVELLEVTKTLATAILEAKTRLNKIVADNHINAEISYFLFVVAIVFIVPIVAGASGSGIAMTAISALFLIGPTFALVSAIPLLQKTNAAARNIHAVEMRLGEAVCLPAVVGPQTREFEHISFKQVTYRYGRENDGFTFGPIDLDIRRGEITFITGGNGSGKSTLLRLLCGLYAPLSGELRIDDRLVEASDLESYRGLFAAIFSDNHLFETLYGIPAPDPLEVTELLRLMELEQKTGIVGRTFSDVNLSTGQRKRLAMIALVLERRPICIFDEWAADQDVHFRQKFYQVILPWLKSQGKTVIAVTHDERYFDAADQRIHLEVRAPPPIQAE